MKTKRKVWLYVILALVIFVGAVIIYKVATAPQSVQPMQFIQMVEGGEVKKVDISGDNVTFYDNDGTKYATVIHYNVEEISVGDKTYTVAGFITAYNDQLETEQGRIELVLHNRDDGNILAYILYGIMAVLAIVLVVSFIRNMSDGGAGKGAMNFGKSRANMQSNIKVRFSDVAGAEEEKEELKEIVEFLKHPQKYTEVGARIPRGVLLVGPPGTGKTLFAKAVAGEANVPFFSISGSDFVEMYVGVGASRVRDLFETAKRNMPCIVFIDEIDAVGRQRGAGLGGGNDEREQTLNQLLVQMDGFGTNEGIIIMAATNRSDILDPALLRPGRFDRQILVNAPDVRGREAIFRVHARNKPIASNVDFKVLARITSGLTGADIANILNEAAILCARDNRTKINMEDIDEAINKVSMGPEKKSRLVTEYDKRITAYHEAGHAIVLKNVCATENVHMVTIVPRGMANGFTAYRPERDSTHRCLSEYKADIAMGMGGRAAEKLVIEDITSGAVADIQQATKTARAMVTRFGMSALGPVCYDSSQEVFIGRDYQQTVNYSEETAAKIDEEIKKLIDEGYNTAINVLEQNRDKLDTMVRVLLECETIYSEEVEMIMQGKGVDEVVAALGEHVNRKNADKKFS